MAKISTVKAKIAKKSKRKAKLSKNKSKNKIKIIKSLETPQKKSSNTTTTTEVDITKDENKVDVQSKNKKVALGLSSEQFAERFPVFKNEDLTKKFLAVTMTNNQKGRIRQTLRDSLKGTSELLLPEVIHSRVQAIVKEAADLTDAELRKIRILYNMLKTTVDTKQTAEKVKKSKKKKNKPNKFEKETKDKHQDDIEDEKLKDIDKVDEEDTNENNTVKDKVKKDKIKGPKRYVVFVGNLPLDIDKDKIMKHFNEFKDYVVDIRIPKPKEGKKSSIAYVELKNELCYELALSKHHSMLANKRINVLYSTQKNSKVTEAEAKGKTAKLVALQRSGKLAGSIPLNRKRSQRRMKAKQARAKLEPEA